MSLEQVAERTGRKPATIRQWIRVHGVRSWTNRTGTYVIEAEILMCERDRRAATRETRRVDNALTSTLT
jgi:uncharacterized protein YjcR